MMRAFGSRLVCVVIAVLVLSAEPPLVEQTQTLRFGVGPLQATPAETKKAFEPFFADLAKKLEENFVLLDPAARDK